MLLLLLFAVQVESSQSSFLVLPDAGEFLGAALRCYLPVTEAVGTATNTAGTGNGSVECYYH
jgi:hypothetical protein